MKETNKIKLAKMSGEMLNRYNANEKDIVKWRNVLDEILEDEC